MEDGYSLVLTYREATAIRTVRCWRQNKGIKGREQRAQK